MASKAKAEGMHSLKWRTADMLDMPFRDQQFDVVLEKGTMDVLFVDNDSPWNPKPDVCSRVHKLLGEVRRYASSPMNECYSPNKDPESSNNYCLPV